MSQWNNNIENFPEMDTINSGNTLEETSSITEDILNKIVYALIYLKRRVVFS